MIEIPEELRSVFTATVREQDGEHVVTIPKNELKHDAVTAGETYRIAVLKAPTAATNGSQFDETAETDEHRDPPVEEGEVREVTIESVGDQGEMAAAIEPTAHTPSEPPRGAPRAHPRVTIAAECIRRWRLSTSRERVVI